MTNPDEWVIWSTEHAGWWRTNGTGYTSRLAEAGTYTWAHADEICRRANAGPKLEEWTIPLWVAAHVVAVANYECLRTQAAVMMKAADKARLEMWRSDR